MPLLKKMNPNLSSKIITNRLFKKELFRKLIHGIILTLLLQEMKYKPKILLIKLGINLLIKIIHRMASLKFRKKRKPRNSQLERMDGEIKKNDNIY